MTPQTSSHLPAKICIIIALIWIALFSYFVFLTNIAGPSNDDWNIMYFVKAVSEGRVTASLLFERFYGAHTPMLSRFLFSIEYFLFKGTGIFTKIIPLLAISATFLIFYKNISIEKTFTNESKVFLIFFGLILVFSYRQLTAFNYAFLGMQHVCAVAFSSLAFHFFSKDTNNNKKLTFSQLAIYLLLGSIASLFTVVGLFCLGSILIGLIIRRAPKIHIATYIISLIFLAYLFRPDDILLRATNDIDVISRFTADEFLKKAGIVPSQFFPFFFIYLFAYFGAILEAVSFNASLALGGFLLCIFTSIGTRELFRRQPTLLFFQLFLYMAGAHAIFSALGRYSTNDYQFSRFFSIYCWLIWSGCILTFATHKKIGAWLCIIIATLSISTNYAYLNRELGYSYNAKKADINMINNSFPHMAYNKTPTPLGLLNFSVETFHQFQKDRQWGIYRFPFNPDLSMTNQDVCEATKTKEFIVSEKQFVEYQLDAWNISENKKIDYFYAINRIDNAIVAYGISMPRQPTLLPTFMLPRSDVMIYTVIPRRFRLTELRLVGGNKASLCEIRLTAKIPSL